MRLWHFEQSSLQDLRQDWGQDISNEVIPFRVVLRVRVHWTRLKSDSTQIRFESNRTRLKSDSTQIQIKRILTCSTPYTQNYFLRSLCSKLLPVLLALKVTPCALSTQNYSLHSTPCTQNYFLRFLCSKLLPVLLAFEITPCALCTQNYFLRSARALCTQNYSLCSTPCAQNYPLRSKLFIVLKIAPWTPCAQVYGQIL